MADAQQGETSESFKSQWITDFFHSFPHYNLEFASVNSTFDPENGSYREALILWAASPLVICILFWLIFTFYFIVRCCQRTKSSKTAGSACPKIFTGLLIFITICLLGVSFYENEQAHDGVDKLRHSVKDINSTVASASNTITLLDDVAVDVSDHLAEDLRQKVLQIPNITIRNELLKQIDNIKTQAAEVQKHLNGFIVRHSMDRVDEFLSITDEVEYWRWLITIVILCVFTVILVLGFAGLIGRSCSFLICSTIMSIICSVFIWTSCGVYLGSSVSRRPVPTGIALYLINFLWFISLLSRNIVALGDFCNDPATYALSLIDDPETKAVVDIYIKCSDPHQPYEKDILDAQSAVSAAAGYLNTTATEAQPFMVPGLDDLVSEMNQDFQNSIGNLSVLLQSVGMCTHLHKQYISGLNGTCDKAFTAVALLTLMSLIIALCCVVITFLSSCVWRQYRKHRLRQEYEPVDDTDPFLPHPPPYEAGYGAMRFSSPTPWSERGALQAASSPSLRSDEGVMMLPRHHTIPLDDSPPPAPSKLGSVSSFCLSEDD